MATAQKEKLQTATGQVVQVVGVIVDVEFKPGKLPAINNALNATLGDKTLLLEVAQHLSENVVRTIALATTDGLKRGDAVVVRFRAAHHCLPPPVPHYTVRRLRAGAVEPVEWPARKPDVELCAATGELLAQAVEYFLLEAVRIR